VCCAMPAKKRKERAPFKPKNTEAYFFFDVVCFPPFPFPRCPQFF
jgi:hypothetical protein